MTATRGQNGEREPEERERKLDGGSRRQRRSEGERASKSESETASTARGSERGLNGFQTGCAAEWSC